jgi:hypothetical protein
MYFNLKYLPTYFICLCGFISHSLLLIAFIKDPLKWFRNSGTYLVANLAVADLTICLCGPLVSVSVHWSINIIWQVALCGSQVTIVSIAADRYLMVAFPFKHRSLMKGKKFLIWITFIWVLSCSTPVNILLYILHQVFTLLIQ